MPVPAYVKCSDEHGVISDPNGVLKINEKLRLVPGHCDPTCNVHDWYVGVRAARWSASGPSPRAAWHIEGPMLIVSEETCRQVVNNENAFTAIEGVFATMARGDAYNFPVVREAIGHADALYGFKSGFDRAGGVLGLKAGGYWPGNEKRALTNHQSTVFLFNPDTGQPTAMVAGNYLTAIRPAAASKARAAWS